MIAVGVLGTRGRAYLGTNNEIQEGDLMRTSVMLLVFVCSVGFGARVACAQAAPPGAAPPGAQPPDPTGMQLASDSTAHTHHGLFLRIMTGPAGFDMTGTVGSDKYSIGGGGGGFSLAIGGAIARSLVLYAEVFDDVAVGPSVTMNDQNLGTTGNNFSAGVVGYGAGFAYFYPSNLYLSATFAAARVSFVQNNQDVARSGTGFGTSLAIGKQWWVSDGWGLGVSLQLFGGTIPGSDSDPNSTSWSTGGAMFAFSATYH